MRAHGWASRPGCNMEREDLFVTNEHSGGCIVTHPSKEDGWGSPFCGDIGNAGTRVGQPPHTLVFGTNKQFFGRVVMRLAMGLPLVASCSGCNQSAVTMGLGAGLTGGKLALFSRSSTTSWTTDSEYLFGADFFLHSKKITL